ncbi:hypothetical protein Cch01nite_01860 [Cellulomonas chitinilytica]|uniref:Lipoprotein n=1 Tax=Cellulomonas chitinilytica TaxID=398759 RepID=A0A919U0E1_9CELL|nr:hypothetical protein [Cellulomonas chitinilytica]GIG19462.1 hypothetical protein Cch01nite_01860 [Cellulomonas chitinilytica]
MTARARAGGGRSGRAVAVPVLLPVLVLGPALLAGCAGSPEPTTPVARVASQADCLAPQVLSALELVPASTDGKVRRTAHPDVPAAGRIPDDFMPESVVTCTTGERLRDASGTWAAVTQARLEGDLGPLLALIDRNRTEPAGTCGGEGPTRTVVWLVDALGRAVRPLVPVDPCGAPTQEVRDTLAALDGTDSTDYPVELLVPRGTPRS